MILRSNLKRENKLKRTKTPNRGMPTTDSVASDMETSSRSDGRERE